MELALSAFGTKNVLRDRNSQKPFEACIYAVKTSKPAGMTAIAAGRRETALAGMTNIGFIYAPAPDRALPEIRRFDVDCALCDFESDSTE